MAHRPPTPRPLPRSLGAIGIFLLTLSATTPASSVFVIVPGMLRTAGTGTLAAFLLAALVCVGTAFVYAELSSAFPNAGGEYVMVARTLGPLPGFVVLGINVFNNILFPPVVGLGLSAVLATVVPGLPQVPVAIAVVAGSTLCALLAIRANAIVTGLFLLVEVAALALVVAAGVGGSGPRSLTMLLHPVMLDHGGLTPAPLAGIGLATTIAIFALNGYGMAVYFGEEMHDAHRGIARVILASFALALLCELVPVAAALGATMDLAGLFAAEDPFGMLVRARFGGWAAAGVALGVGIAIVNAAIVTVLASARFLYATARDGVWGGGFDRAIGRVHRRSGGPWVATLVIGAIGVAACFLSLPFLLVLNGGGLIATYAAISVAALRGRGTGATAHAHYRMPLHPIVPLFVLVALAGTVYGDWLDRDEGRPGMIATLVQIVGATVYYLLVVRRRGTWATRDAIAQ